MYVCVCVYVCIIGVGVDKSLFSLLVPIFVGMIILQARTRYVEFALVYIQVIVS